MISTITKWHLANISSLKSRINREVLQKKIFSQSVTRLTPCQALKVSFNSRYIYVGKTKRGYNLLNHAIPVCDGLRSHEDNVLGP